VLQGKIDEVLADLVRDPVPYLPQPGRAIRQGIDPAFNPAGIPVLVRAAGDADHGEFLLDRQVRGCNRAYDLKLL
jgi:hypothetical protein